MIVGSDYLDYLISYIYSQQQSLHRQLAVAIRSVKEGGVTAMLGLIMLSFFYGIFHAAGPGHGKAVITTYIATHENQLKRAMLLSLVASMAQGFSAIIIVGGVLFFVNRHENVLAAAKLIELFSFGLIASLGMLLVYRSFISFRKKGMNHQIPSHKEKACDHDDDGNECSICGHSHAIDPNMINEKTSWKESLAVIFSVGIRPCNGSVLVIIFSTAVGLHWIGISSVLAISLGTAITVSFLAFIAVYFRKFTLLISEKSLGGYLERTFLFISILGALIITLLGTSLFIQSLTNTHPLFRASMVLSLKPLM
ncbi:MAG: nickel/cobalt transporter [Bacteroidota bacterium]